MLIQIRTLENKDLRLGIWRLPNSVSHGGKRAVERAAAHELLSEMLGYPVEIQHDTNGAPLVEGFHISISHTRGYLVILLSKCYRVGVDIEYRSDRISKIASRFLRQDEPFELVGDMLLCWCAKEALYKLRSSAHLTYEQMRVRLSSSLIDDLVQGDTVSFHQAHTSEYVLVWMWEKDNSRGDSSNRGA